MRVAVYPLLLAMATGLSLHSAPRLSQRRAAVLRMAQPDIERKTGDNVEQIKDTKRDKVMTFSYDMVSRSSKSN